MRFACVLCSKKRARGELSKMHVMDGCMKVPRLSYVCSGCKDTLKKPSNSPKGRRLGRLVRCAQSALNHANSPIPPDMRGPEKTFREQFRHLSHAEMDARVQKHQRKLRAVSGFLLPTPINSSKAHLPPGTDRLAIDKKRTDNRHKRYEKQRREEKRRKGGRPPKGHRETARMERREKRAMERAERTAKLVRKRREKMYLLEDLTPAVMSTSIEPTEK